VALVRFLFFSIFRVLFSFQYLIDPLFFFFSSFFFFDLGMNLSGKTVDEFCLRMRWAACELSCHQLRIGKNNMTAEDAVSVQLACQTLGRQASTSALDENAGHDNTIERTRHSESTGSLTSTELTSIRRTVSEVIRAVDEILVEKGMMSADNDAHPASNMAGTKWGALQVRVCSSLLFLVLFFFNS
jgi:hypothetical protein